MQVNTNVSEADIGRIAKGQEATFTVDAYPDRNFQGKVSEVRNAPMTIQNVVTYDVVIQVDNSDLRLKPGMTANVSVQIEHKENILKIPNSALRFRPETAKKEETSKASNRKQIWGLLTEEQKEKLKETGRSSERTQAKPGRVWILTPEGKPAPVEIMVGITDGTFSELVKGNLQEGAEVVVEEIVNRKARQSIPAPSTKGLR
jgi:HlyD family secretion protein